MTDSLRVKWQPYCQFEIFWGKSNKSLSRKKKNACYIGLYITVKSKMWDFTWLSFCIRRLAQCKICLEANCLSSSYSERKHPTPTFISLKHRLEKHVTFLNESFVDKTFQLWFFLEKRRYLSDQHIRIVLAFDQAFREERRKSNVIFFLHFFPLEEPACTLQENALVNFKRENLLWRKMPLPEILRMLLVARRTVLLITCSGTFEENSCLLESSAPL